MKCTPAAEMKPYIAFFRGINVGGKNKLPIEDLVAVLESIGARKVRTYIQSGNAVFEISGTSLARFAKDLSSALRKRCGFGPYVHILTPEELASAVKNNPFPEAVIDPSSLHLGFLSSPPRSPNLERLVGVSKESERFLLTDRVFYLHAPDGLGRSKLAAISEKQLGVSMTVRNWKTVCKVMEMAKL